jgi:RNA polymerase sigma-70 factor (ECF subfamily)
LSHEEALLARACLGDREALEAIVREHGAAVYAIALGYADRSEADDLAQEVFLRVVQGLASFDGKSQLATWIFRVATNAGLNHVRSKKRRPAPARLANDAAVPSSRPDPATELDAREEEAALRRALDTLPEEFRAVAVLRVQQGLSFEEIALVLGIARPTAESRMARAKDKLRVLLEPWLEPDVKARLP